MASILKFSSGGELLAKWGRWGSELGRFAGPKGIAMDREGNLYVADWGNARIQKLSQEGEVLAIWGGMGEDAVSILAISSLFLSRGPSVAGWMPVIGVYFLFIALTSLRFSPPLSAFMGGFAEHTRASDVVARVGGDEFGVLLSPIEVAPARASAERLCEAVRQLPFERGHALEGVRISVTVGLACFPDDARDLNSLVAAADRAMYRAKKQGKGRVEVLG